MRSNWILAVHRCVFSSCECFFSRSSQWNVRRLPLNGSFVLLSLTIITATVYIVNKCEKVRAKANSIIKCDFGWKRRIKIIDERYKLHARHSQREPIEKLNAIPGRCVNASPELIYWLLLAKRWFLFIWVIPTSTLTPIKIALCRSHGRLLLS